MGLFKKRRDQGEEANWTMLLSMMLFGYELERAEALGLDHDGQGSRATEVRDRVLQAIGGEAQFVSALLGAYEDLGTYDADVVLPHALETSGYLEARNQLFPD
jgi:hypothetical protein